MNLLLVMCLGLSPLGQTATPLSADLNGDGVIDHEDLALFHLHWHERGSVPVATPTPTHTSVPTDTPAPTSTPAPTNTPGELPTAVTIDLPGLPAGAKPLEMVLLPAGSFLMGSSDAWSSSKEQPVHEVTIGYPFYISTCEVTQAQWLAVMGTWPGTAPNTLYGLGDDYPAYYVSWQDCQTFVGSLNQTGQGTFRLPSEAEWEYACRGSESNPNRYARFFFGDSDCPPDQSITCNLDNYAWWSGNSPPTSYGAKEAGGKIANDYGLFDIHGNVWEWCLDYAHDDYTGAPSDGSPWVSPASSYRIARGGSWNLDANYSRSAYRQGEPPSSRAAWFGFRLVREAR